MEVVVLLKPDIVINNEIPAITKEITKNLWTIEIKKMVMLNEEFIKSFYSEYKNEIFFEENILKNMMASPVVAMIVKTKWNVNDFYKIKDIKEQIRKKFAKDKSRNSIHISDSFESAQKERWLLGWMA